MNAFKRLCIAGLLAVSAPAQGAMGEGAADEALAHIPTATQLLEDGDDQLKFTDVSKFKWDKMKTQWYLPEGELLGPICRYQVPTKGKDAWDKLGRATLGEGIQSNEYYALALFVRLLPEEGDKEPGSLKIVVRESAAPGRTFFDEQLTFGSDWKPFYFLAKASENWPLAEFLIGFSSRVQTFEIKGLVLARFIGEPRLADIMPGKFPVDHFIRKVRGKH
ncbi:MAG: hypothetical protein J0L75_05855 [Spirochaetes bacterium]|nr:hypothetical protein [Spirochaetota bacterium]